MIDEVNTETFETKVLNAEMPVVVDVWAPWCGPCKALTPILESTAERFSGQAQFYKLNADENPELVRKYKVMGIPALLYFNHGYLIDRKTGLQSEKAIAKRLTPLLGLSQEDAAAQEFTGLFRFPFRRRKRS